MQQGYAANGATTTIQGFNGTGTSTPFTHLLAFNQDGEGRPYGSWDVTNGSTVYWGGTNYNAASQPTLVSLTSGAESFLYDAKSDRTTRWQSTAGTSTQTGNLTWNPNGTLQKMVIADNANSGNAQTCTYGYDDLVRLLNATCGSAWAQTFAYDFYGNIWKAGNVNFQNGYGSGNHVLGFTYDGNGDVTNDGVNTYTYDAEGRATAEAGKTLLYDALDRLSSIGGAQVLYLPSGQKFAFMNGTTVQSYITPMAGGMQAVWNGTGLAYYRHVDWLGSARFESTPAGTVYADRAYAPFGEAYAEWGAVDRSFTGQTQDVAPGSTGIYDFLFRQQSAAQGLWLVPDPAGLAAVDITNPQSWDRYAYVGNNPLSKVDPLGLDTDCTTDQETDLTTCVTTVLANPAPDGGGGGGGTATGSGGRGGRGTKFNLTNPFTMSPNDGRSAADIARCAARVGNSLSLAALLPQGSNQFLQNALSNDFSTVSDLVTGPSGATRLDAAASLLQGKLTTTVKAVGAIPVGPDMFQLGVNGAGTTFAEDVVTTPLAERALGAAAGALLGTAVDVKLAWDAATYTYGVVKCW